MELNSNDLPFSDAPQSDDSSNPATLLQPDHPLMHNFQNSLKAYFQNINQKLSEQIIFTKSNLKQLKKNYEEEICERVYKTEKQIEFQRKVIKTYEENFLHILKSKNQSNQLVNTKRNSLHVQRQNLEYNNDKTEELRRELEALQQIHRQFVTLKNDTQTELLINRGVSEKLATEKRIISIQQKQLDGLMYDLTKEIWNIKSKNFNLNSQLSTKSRELGVATNRIVVLKMDLEILHNEYVRLAQIWGSIITNIQQKDKTHSALRSAYRNIQSNIQTITVEIEFIKNETNIQIERNENITIKKNDLQYKLNKSNHGCTKLHKKVGDLQEINLSLLKILSSTEKDFDFISKENDKLKKKYQAISDLLQKKTKNKIDCENETLDLLQERITTDKHIDSIATILKKLKLSTRITETDILEAENTLTKFSLEIEKLKLTNEELKVDKSKIHSDQERKINSGRDFERKLTGNTISIKRKQIQMSNLSKKLNSFVDKMHGSEISPQEKMVLQLTDQVQKNIEKLNNQEALWMTQQKNVFGLIKQFQKQTSDIESLRRHIELWRNKYEKLDNNLKSLKENESGINNVLERTRAQLIVLEAKKFHNQIGNNNLKAKLDNFTVTNISKIKDAEIKTAVLEENINNLEILKENVAKEIDQIKKQFYMWSKKMKLLTETKDKLSKGSNMCSDETKQMRNEIHRMQVRYSQLHKYSKRLSIELAECVSKRESAYYHALSHQTPPTSQPQSGQNTARHINQLIKTKMTEFTIMSSEWSTLDTDLKNNLLTIDKIQSEVDSLQNQIQCAQLKKQTNLETILRCQQVAKTYNWIIEGKCRNIKTSTSLTSNQNELYSKILELVNKLLVKTKQSNSFELQQILNMLNSIYL